MTGFRLQTARLSPADKVASEEEIRQALTLADAALGAAGHEVTDEETRALGRRIAAGTLSGDDAAAVIAAKHRAK